MFIHCELVILITALSLNGQVHTGRIYGGHRAVAHSRPYMVLLKQQMENNETISCDGFLLNEEFVMTAAHCKSKNYTALLGVHNYHDQRGVQFVPVEQAFPHEDFNTRNYNNDIMLLKLSSKVHFSKTVKSIVLASDGFQPKSCLVCGWGLIENEMSPTLMEVNVTLKERCPRNKLYCSEGQNGPRQGDSGGPLVCEDGRAYGVVSSGFKRHLDDPWTYTFTKISDYIDWINSTMGNV